MYQQERQLSGSQSEGLSEALMDVHATAQRVSSSVTDLTLGIAPYHS